MSNTMAQSGELSSSSYKADYISESIQAMSFLKQASCDNDLMSVESARTTTQVARDRQVISVSS